MISELSKVDMPSKIENTIKGITIYYNVPPVTEIGGEIDIRTTATDMTIITTPPASPVATKSAKMFTNRSTTILTRPNTSVSSKSIIYTPNLRRITRAKS